MLVSDIVCIWLRFFCRLQLMAFCTLDEASSRIQISGKRQEEAKNHILNLMARRRARNTTGGTSVTVPSLKCPPVAMAASHSDNEPSLLSGVEEEPIDWQKAARDSVCSKNPFEQKIHFNN